VHGYVAPRAVNLLYWHKIVAEQGAVAATGAVDDYDMGGKTHDPSQTLPIDVGPETDLTGKGGTLFYAATDIAGELRERVECQENTLVFKVGTHAAPIAKQVFDGGRHVLLRRGLRARPGKLLAGVTVAGLGHRRPTGGGGQQAC
jgi:hypothetical protein